MSSLLRLALALVLVGVLAMGCSITTSDNSSDDNSGNSDSTGDDGSGSGDDTGGDSSGDDGGTAGSITFLGASGDAVSADGVWEECYDNAGEADTMDRQTFDGEDVTIESYVFTSTDASCSEGETLDGEATVGTMVQGEDVALVAWSSGADITDAPDAADGSGPLDDPPMVSLVEVYSGSELLGVFARMIDDTGETLRMYRDHGDPAETCDIGENYDGCLHAIDYLSKVE